MNPKIKYTVLFFGLMILLNSCTNNYKEGMKKYNEKNFDNALVHLRKVESTDKNYKIAQNKIREIDSILFQIKKEKIIQDSVSKVEKASKDSIARIKREQKEIEDFKIQLSREIESFKTINGETYRDDVSSIQLEIALFKAWANNIKKAKNHKDKEINRLGNTLNLKTIALQKSEFPQLRKNYGDILKQKLWLENIKVKTKGTGYNTLEFEGGIFANNKNKQNTQQTLSEMLNLLRFKRINYKWYEYDDDYTYYSLKTLQDGDLVEL
ncbi:MAG TPA: hypothetical protein VLZ83_07760 [Edaphocola sp.]|nr:hypothetical protein [Edaphocola sp.]